MNNSKIVSATKTASSVLLAIVLVAGTIAAISPLFIIKGVNAQGDQPYYDEMDSYGPTDYTERNSYGPKTSYGMDDNNYESDYGIDNDRKSYITDSYEPTTLSYGNDNNYYNSYESRDYGMDNNDRKSYGMDGYKSQYQSYKPDYKPKYSSYVKDDRDKSTKDSSSKSVSINKFNCINTNININGNNTGDINLGNKGAAEEGYLGAYSSDSGEYGNERYYDDGYNNNKKDKGFDCIINNNNINFETISPEPSKASLKVIKNVTCTYLEPGELNPQLACGRLGEEITEDQFLIEVTNDNPVPSQFNGSESGTIVTLGAGNYIVSETIDASVEEDIKDLEEEFFDETIINYEIFGPITTFTGDCIPVNADSEATGTIRAGESQTCEIENHFEIGAVTSAFTTGSSITTQETEDSSELTALAKITKLKQQWLDQIS